MKIALVTAQLSMGGAEKMVVQLARGLHKRGESVIVIAGEGQYAKSLRNLGIEVIHIPFDQKKVWWRLSVWKRLGQILKTENFDVVHVHTVPLAFLLRGILRIAHLQAQTVLTLHGSPLWKLRCARPLIKGLNLKRCAVSPDLASFLDASYIPNAVGSFFSGTEEERCEHQRVKLMKLRNQQVIHVGMVARLVKEKGIDMWFEAVHILKNKGIGIYTSIAGDGPERQRLTVQSKALGIEVEFLGWQCEPWRLMQDFDLFVLSSRREGEPLALLEAMALGLPALATKVGGIASLLTSGAGLLVEPTVQGLAEGIVEFLAMPRVDQNQMVRIARERVSERTWDQIVDAYLGIYQGGKPWHSN